jgi:hypothetical protein
LFHLTTHRAPAGEKNYFFLFNQLIISGQLKLIKKKKIDKSKNEVNTPTLPKYLSIKKIIYEKTIFPVLWEKFVGFRL